MDLKSPPFRWLLTQLPGALLCISLGACVVAPGGAGAAPHGITEVVLERDCMGCATGTVLVLRSDGSATLTEVGKARLGTEDKLRRARISPRDFDALAQLLVQRGFFGLAEKYEEPGLQDGAWTVLRATRAGQVKEVFVREDAAPPELRAVQTAIAALQSRVLGGP